MMNDRYILERAVNKIDGYYTPQNSEEKVQAEFDRAKSELLSILLAEIEFIKNMTLDKFLKARKRSPVNAE